MRYDDLKLNTRQRSSHLPGLRYPRRTATFLSRDEFVEHLEMGAQGLDIRFNTAGERLDRLPVGWRLTTSAGLVDALNVVVATGHQRIPQLPKYSGMQGFTGELLHSADYRNPSRFGGLRVMVVGCGSSGMEIANGLANGGAAKVWMARRTPPNIMLRTGPAGVAGDTIALGFLPRPSQLGYGCARARDRSAPSLTSSQPVGGHVNRV